MEAKCGNGGFQEEEGRIQRHWKQNLQRTLSFGLRSNGEWGHHSRIRAQKLPPERKRR